MLSRWATTAWVEKKESWQIELLNISVGHQDARGNNFKVTKRNLYRRISFSLVFFKHGKNGQYWLSVWGPSLYLLVPMFLFSLSLLFSSCLRPATTTIRPRLSFNLSMWISLTLILLIVVRLFVLEVRIRLFFCSWRWPYWTYQLLKVIFLYKASIRHSRQKQNGE